MTRFDELHLAQEGGQLPTVTAAGGAPGESGVSVLGLQFRGGVHFKATPRRHLVWFMMSEPVRFDCRIADQRLRHRPPLGQLTICPAGADSSADAEEGAKAILVAIDPRYLTLAAAEEAALEARLIERLSSFDRRLLELGRILALESAAGFPNGALFWNDIASGFLGDLVARHTAEAQTRPRGMLGKKVLERLREHIVDHLDEAVDVAALANIAGRSPFHFSRLFARSVGLTPHQYVVRLRLQRAIELVRQGRLNLAEIAARTGFADQSHLSRWVRRVHGVSLTQLGT